MKLARLDGAGCQIPTLAAAMAYLIRAGSSQLAVQAEPVSYGVCDAATAGSAPRLCEGLD